MERGRGEGAVCHLTMQMTSDSLHTTCPPHSGVGARERAIGHKVSLPLFSVGPRVCISFSITAARSVDRLSGEASRSQHGRTAAWERGLAQESVRREGGLAAEGNSERDSRL
jgi:hypothetical protein